MDRISEDEIEDDKTLAQFITQLDLQRVDAEAGELIFTLEGRPDPMQVGRVNYRLYVRPSRTSRSGTQSLLVNQDTDERVWEA